MTKPNIEELKNLARKIRCDILVNLHKAGSGHPGGSLSMVEILISLYYYKLRHDPKNPAWAGRDILVLSKGHGAMGLYTVLARRGFFPVEELANFRKLGSRLQGHIYRGVPGVEASTGSLGQGLSIANGFAYAARLDKADRRVYCITGDGELDEGQIWEAAMSASHHRLDNLVCIVDRNGVQQNGPTEKIKQLEPLADKWRACGWNVFDIDGHDIEALIGSLDKAQESKGRPSVIIAKTVKGKGVSFMEGNAAWHGKAPSADDLAKALKECGFRGGV